MLSLYHHTEIPLNLIPDVDSQPSNQILSRKDLQFIVKWVSISIIYQSSSGFSEFLLTFADICLGIRLLTSLETLPLYPTKHVASERVLSLEFTRFPRLVFFSHDIRKHHVVIPFQHFHCKFNRARENPIEDYPFFIKVLYRNSPYITA